MKFTSKSDLLTWSFKSKKFTSFNFEGEFTNYSTGISGRDFENCVAKLYSGGTDLYQPNLTPQEYAAHCIVEMEKSENHIFYNVCFCSLEKKLFFVADIVVKGSDNKLKVIEVKDSMSIRYSHINDVGFQYLVLKSLGINKFKICIAKPNKEYRNGGKLDLIQYIDEIDVTIRAKYNVPLIERLLYQRSIDRSSHRNLSFQPTIKQSTYKSTELNVQHFSAIPEVINIFQSPSVDQTPIIPLENNTIKKYLKFSHSERFRKVKSLKDSSLRFVFIATARLTPPLPGYTPADAVVLNISILTLHRQENKLSRIIITPDEDTDLRSLAVTVIKQILNDDIPIITYGNIIKDLIDQDINQFSEIELQKYSEKVLNIHSFFFDYKREWEVKDWNTKTALLLKSALNSVAISVIPEFTNIPSIYNWTKLDLSNMWSRIKLKSEQSNSEKHRVMIDKEMFEFACFFYAYKIYLIYMRIEQTTLNEINKRKEAA